MSKLRIVAAAMIAAGTFLVAAPTAANASWSGLNPYRYPYSRGPHLDGHGYSAGECVSFAAWAPNATAESWARGGPYCNAYAYRFGDVELAHSRGSWTRLRHSEKLQDPGWRVHRLSRSTFSATPA